MRRELVGTLTRRRSRWSVGGVRQGRRGGRAAVAARPSGEAAVKTGPGATADTITLGYLPDLSGVFAPNGKAMMEGANLYWDAKNKAGGICGRQVKMSVQDTGYDPQKAVAAYQQTVRRRDRARPRARLLDRHARCCRTCSRRTCS